MASSACVGEDLLAARDVAGPVREPAKLFELCCRGFCFGNRLERWQVCRALEVRRAMEFAPRLATAVVDERGLPGRSRCNTGCGRGVLQRRVRVSAAAAWKAALRLQHEVPRRSNFIRRTTDIPDAELGELPRRTAADVRVANFEMLEVARFNGLA